MIKVEAFRSDVCFFFAWHFVCAEHRHCIIKNLELSSCGGRPESKIDMQVPWAKFIRVGHALAIMSWKRTQQCADGTTDCATWNRSEVSGFAEDLLVKEEFPKEPTPLLQGG